MLEKERIAKTKHWIQHIILSKKLGVDIQIPDEDWDWMVCNWGSESGNRSLYGQLWDEVEKEMHND
jgi:hypothetical protein